MCDRILRHGRWLRHSRLHCLKFDVLLLLRSARDGAAAPELEPHGDANQAEDLRDEYPHSRDDAVGQKLVSGAGQQTCPRLREHQVPDGTENDGRDHDGVRPLSFRLIMEAGLAVAARRTVAVAADFGTRHSRAHNIGDQRDHSRGKNHKRGRTVWYEAQDERGDVDDQRDAAEDNASDERALDAAAVVGTATASRGSSRGNLRKRDNLWK